jgi:phosphoribosyl 1,2-cyclic phosphate phosphodiesterase
LSYPPLTITILGTGTSSGVPMIACPCEVCSSTNPKDKRLRCSILDAILFTHPHKDHVAGLDDVRAFNFFSGKPMNIYANELTQEIIIREFPYAFTDTRYPGLPEITLNPIDIEPFTIGDIPVTPVLVWHLKMPVLAFRFGQFTYITDANRIDAAEKEKIKGTEVLVVNALRKEKHISHFSLDEAVQLAQELQVPQTWLTHISHQLGRHDDVNKELPKGIGLGYDMLQIKI